MAGMLPGVECARRRRLHGSTGWCDSSSVIGYGFGSPRIRLSHDSHLTPTSFLQRRMVTQSDGDAKLLGAAREARERLDGRLRGHLKNDIRRKNSQEGLNSVGKSTRTPVVMENLQMESFGLKKNGLKRFRWVRMGLIWNSSKDDECAICLDECKASEKVTNLPCTHRFHSDCLLPWLESNTHCPCCRATVFGSN